MKYVHTNIITDDWKRLAGFYVQVFGCKLVLPQRHLSGNWLSKGTGVERAEIHGAHLRLPGYGKDGPTLEIFEYQNNISRPTSVANEKGFGHLAFEVEDVKAVYDKALAFGGKHYGEIVQHPVPGVGLLTFVYVRDPDGNIVELQHWKRDAATEEAPPFEVVVKDDTPPSADKPVVAQEPAPIPSVVLDNLTPEDDLDDAVPLDKRAYLDSLQNDLDDSSRSVHLSKAEIRAMKEEARLHQQHIKRGLKYDPDQPLEVKKTKEELLQELKNEDKTILPLDKQPINPDVQRPLTIEPKAALLPLPQHPAALTVELQLEDKQVELLDLSGLELGLAPELLAEQLRAFITVGHPKQPEYTFLQRLGKQYRADLVPLVKHKRPDAAISAQKEAWILVPRLRDSLGHFVGQLETSAKTLQDLGVEQLGLTPEAIVAAYKAVQTIVQAAEAQSAEYIRFTYFA